MQKLIDVGVLYDNILNGLYEITKDEFMEYGSEIWMNCRICGVE